MGLKLQQEFEMRKMKMMLPSMSRQEVEGQLLIYAQQYHFLRNEIDDLLKERLRIHTKPN